jgi:predicted phosphodiesterase
MRKVLQYMSDLHTERLKDILFLQKPSAPFLVLAGDIGCVGSKPFHRFLDHVSYNWDMVFYVPGNHEYYSTPDDPESFNVKHKRLLDTVSLYKNIKLLHADAEPYYLTEESAIVGATLWYPAATRPDYPILGDDLKPVKSKDIAGMFARDSSYLSSSISRLLWEQTRVCVVTHHLPSRRLISEEYANYPYLGKFYSNSEHLMQPNVKVWVYGHTHESREVQLGTVKAVCNAHGARGFFAGKTFVF